MHADFAAVFVALWVGHHFADHWVQTDGQAARKGRRDWVGRRACAAHVYWLTATQVFALVALQFATGSVVATPWQLLTGLALNAATHYWIDRRFTLAALCERLGKGGFYRSGSGLGTGAYALDQSAHLAVLFVVALVMVA